MDKTETYIKMSDCPEIQSDKLTIERGDSWCWKSYPEQVYLHTDPYPLEVCDSRKKRQRNNKVWLPCQDQLQIMLKDIEYTMTYHTTPKPHWDIGFYHFAEDTAEQTLLELVMFELHNKLWIDNEWMLDKTTH